jgi:hypothetical protein
MNTRLLSLAATSTTLLGLMATGAMGSTTALAGGGTNCQNDQSISGVQCLGQINGNNIEIDISNVGNVSQNELNVLNVAVQGILDANKVIVPIQVQVNDIAVAVVPVVIKDLNVLVCQVKVIELGVVNTNIANCN